MTDYKKEKKAPGSESVVCGVHAVESYLGKGEVVRLFHTSEFHHPLVKEAKRRGLPVSKMRKSELDLYATGENHQGVVAFIKGYNYLDFHELLDKLSTQKDPMVLFLDRLTDPHNLGAIARSAYLFGASGLVIPARERLRYRGGSEGLKWGHGAHSHRESRQHGQGAGSPGGGRVFRWWSRYGWGDLSRSGRSHGKAGTRGRFRR